MAAGEILRVCFEIIFDTMPPGGPRFVVAAVLRQTGAPKRVPPILKHSLTIQITDLAEK